MHGIIFTGLKHFVVETYDKTTWNQIREEADVGSVHYTPVSAYPDEDLVALVEAAVELSGIEQSELLRTFGRYVVPTLVDMYGVYIDDDWDALELIENVEGTIHRALRNGETLEYEPPAIAATRLDDDVIVITYGSERGFCRVAMGLLEGIADHYDQRLEVYERRCRHDGASRCELVAVGATTPRRRAERVVEREFESMT
ncbi:heme NO-binding domain-containing protein [Natrinema marinum]|uniref:heme NO-binding domain-containing protein n=1 Tax=Natrinema marinum TaxID=2961598 RepID=UPI0020C8C7D8|nr:heme NO-binding domain-containing protein [Natrinema marinum]